MELTSSVPRPRTAVWRWDAAVAVWVLACAGLALWTGASVQRLEPVGDTLVVASRGLDEMSAVIDTIRDIPFVGDDVSRVGDRIDAAARSARESGIEARTAIDSLALSLPISIFAVAAIPPLVAYIAIRRRWRASERRRT